MPFVYKRLSRVDSQLRYPGWLEYVFDVHKADEIVDLRFGA